MNADLLTRDERLQAVTLCQVFAGSPARDLALLAEIGLAEYLTAGEVLCAVGEPADRIYIVARGRLAVLIPDREAPVRFLGPGDLLGEYGLFGNQVRTATVRAETEALLLSVDYMRFRAFLLQCPFAGLRLLETAVNRLVAAERAQR